MTSKLHGACSKGGPLRLHLSEGQCSEFTGADVVLKDLPPAATVMGDQGYDSDKIRKMLVQQGIPPCIPPRRCRKKPVHYSKRLDRKRHKIENLFSRLKDWRRIATRYDGGTHVFCSAILAGRHCPLLVMSPDPSPDPLKSLAVTGEKESCLIFQDALKLLMTSYSSSSHALDRNFQSCRTIF